MHLDFHQTVAAAGLAPATLHIEGEAARTVAPHFGVVGGGVQVPDVVEQARIGGRIGPGGSADGALVDVDDLVQMLHAPDSPAGAGAGPGVVQLGGQGFIEHLVHQAGFSRAGDAGDAGKGSQWDGHIQILQVVFSGSLHGQVVAVAGASCGGNRNFFHTGQVLARDRPGTGHNVLHAAGCHNLAPMDTGPRAYIHNEVRRPYGVLVMLHHDQGVSDIPQMLQGFQ